MATAKRGNGPQARMPVLFIGHGSPQNALEDNEYTRNWRKAAADIPRPKAILVVSAHWLSEGTAVTAMEMPRTIHDFYGFPRELSEFQYRAKGSPELAGRIRGMVKSVPVAADSERGLDHGAWSVLAQMYPQAGIPVVQLGLDYYLKPDKQYGIGKELAPLRQEGVLVIASGNAVHNLAEVSFGSEPFAWALEFDAFVKASLEARDDAALIAFQSQKSARMAHPTVDHFLPLLYAAGASVGEKPSFFNEGIFAGSVGMRCAAFGLGKAGV